MSLEEKQLLLKDLCARLPYGVRGVHRDRVHYLMNVDWGFGSPSIQVDGYDAWFSIDTFKPYLRPMSSMTLIEADEICSLENNVNRIICVTPMGHTHHFIVGDAVMDWLNAHHFDYRGLIEKELALEAPKDMYNS